MRLNIEVNVNPNQYAFEVKNTRGVIFGTDDLEEALAGMAEDTVLMVCVKVEPPPPTVKPRYKLA